MTSMDSSIHVNVYGAEHIDTDSDGAFGKHEAAELMIMSLMILYSTLVL